MSTRWLQALTEKLLLLELRDASHREAMSPSSLLNQDWMRTLVGVGSPVNIICVVTLLVKVLGKGQGRGGDPVGKG